MMFPKMTQASLLALFVISAVASPVDLLAVKHGNLLKQIRSAGSAGINNVRNFRHHFKRAVEGDPLAGLDVYARALITEQIHSEQAKERPASRADDESRASVIKRDTSKASHMTITVPSIISSQGLGPSVNDPDQQYIDLPSQPLPTLPANLAVPYLTYLPTDEYSHSFWNGSGALELTEATQPYLSSMNYGPSFLRDGGLGGSIGANKLFIFDDSNTYAPDGSWTGFVSNSVALDTGLHAITGGAPTLNDRLGQFANSVGTLRNFIPFTIGEAAYNGQFAGKGQRFAIWSESSIIPVDDQSALLYAPIVYTNTAPGASIFTYVGTTLLRITVPGAGGPVAERINSMLFQDPSVEWGCIGGVRKLSKTDWEDGNANHGRVYIFGKNAAGLLLGRVQVQDVANPAAYEYWSSDGTWTPNQPTSSSTDVFVEGNFATVDVFYSPRHLTFIMISMTSLADNTLYYRYLQSPQPIYKTTYSDGQAADYVENITLFPWSEPQVLLVIPRGASYATSGGMYRSYFDANDITEGGQKMLVGWTQPLDGTGPAALSHNTAIIRWN